MGELKAAKTFDRLKLKMLKEIKTIQELDLYIGRKIYDYRMLGGGWHQNNFNELFNKLKKQLKIKQGNYIPICFREGLDKSEYIRNTRLGNALNILYSKIL